MLRLASACCAAIATMAMPFASSRLPAQSPPPQAPVTTPNQQAATLTGRVIDSTTAQPVAGVQLVIVGTSLGARTDMDGRFRISRVPAGEQRVRFTMIGYSAIERRVLVTADQGATLDVRMQSVATRLNNMVVVGYGTQKAATVTGSVSAVQGSRLEAMPSPNLSNMLGGTLPGVVSVASSGQPGADGATIRIRGSRTLNDNSPLVVIDGVPDRAGGLDRLNPRDIESISVLKDASAAIYGARAANGVILVTTKRGSTGQPELTFSADYGSNRPARLPEMTDAVTYMTMLNEVDQYRGVAPRYSAQQIENFRAGSDPWLYPNTDWFAEVIRSSSPQSRADVSLRGGAERMKYFLSLGTQSQDGYYENTASRYNQYAFRSNIDGKATDHLDIRFDLTGRLEDRNNPNRPASEIFRAIMRGKPNLPAYWPNGLPGPDIEYGNNPVVIGTPATGYDRDQRFYVQGTLNGTLAIPGVKGLTVRAGANYDQMFGYRKQWRTPWTLYTWDGLARDASGQPLLQAAQRGYNAPELQQDNERNNGVLLNVVTDYQRQMGRHSLGLMAGAERQTIDYSSMAAFRKFFLSDQLDEIFAGGDAEKQNGGSAGLARRQNYFSRINYNFADRYLIEFVGRYDGSYIFAQDRRFGFFPGVSGGWRLSEESFVRNTLPMFNDLKLRASWGRTGNDRIDQWQYLASYGYGNGYVFGVNQEVKSIYPTRTPNPDVTWEVANQANLGLDASLFHDRLSFKVDDFTEKRDDILWFRNASVPQSAGLVLPRENIGKVDSRGVDGSVTWRQKLSTNSSFDVTLNGGVTKNTIRFWDEAPGAPEWQRSTGSPMNTGLYYRSIGVFRDQAAVNAYPHWAGARPGDLIFEDVDGDGAITTDDRVRIGKTGEPTFTGGLMFTGRFGGFDATAFFAGATGATQYLATESGDLGNYLADYADNRWTPENPDATQPRTFNGGEYWRSNANTFYLRNADYLRLKTLEIGYRLPQRLLSTMRVRQARVYASGLNLLTWDRMKLMDPEARSSSAQYYPQARVFNFGTSFTF